MPHYIHTNCTAYMYLLVWFLHNTHISHDIAMNGEHTIHRIIIMLSLCSFVAYKIPVIFDILGNKKVFYNGVSLFYN